ncbi:MAG: lysophospholipid acyltransferase family protein [Planctomycetota bacterium]|jgi:1-acyl-sn-glycerol-3-phosphate acyltransferase
MSESRRWWQFRRRVPGRSIPAIIWFGVCRTIVAVTLRAFYRYRVLDRRRIPASGPVLVVANHESFLDPLLVGSAMSDRQFSPLARDSLFRFGPFGALLRSYGCIPVRREGGDAAAMRATIGELKAGRCVAVFPEGTRSSDGRMLPFRRGVLLMLGRVDCLVVPMGVAGTFEVWPKGRSRPRWRGRTTVAVGESIPSTTLRELPADEAIAVLESAVRAQVDRARPVSGLPARGIDR